MKKVLVCLIAILVIMNYNVYAVEEHVDTEKPMYGDLYVGKTGPQQEFYEIQIIWDDLTFNWYYDKDTDEYKWISEENNFSIFNRSSLPEDKVLTIDTIFTPESDYSFTSGKFSYTKNKCRAIFENEYDEEFARDYGYSMDSACSTIVQDPNPSWEENKYYSVVLDYEEYDTERVPDEAMSCKSGYIGDVCLAGIQGDFKLELEVDNTKVNGYEPVVGSKIGTMTIAIGTEDKN